MCSNQPALSVLKKAYPRLRFWEDETTADVLVGRIPQEKGALRIPHEYICDKRWKNITDIIYGRFQMVHNFK